MLNNLRTLGHSSLAVSPMALGTMTFGAQRWGTNVGESRAVFDAYVEAGGNFIDTANVYADGESERMIGAFIAETKARDRMVVASKFGWPPSATIPGGGGAKSLRSALDGSLERLGFDYIDLYWLHVWDRTTPADEMLRVLEDATRSGKILHYGFCNTPGWYVAQVATLARAHGLPGPVALQYGYSLLERGVELDVLPMGEALGLGTVAWSPLGAGMLTGKYGRDMLKKADQPVVMPQQQSSDGGEHRLEGGNPTGGMMFTERNFDLVDVVRDVAEQLSRPMAEVALAWLLQRTPLTSILLGASKAAQVEANLRALDLVIPDALAVRLDEATAPPVFNPYNLFALPSEAVIGRPVERRGGR